ncbi:MAG: TIR domain-containing protein [Bacilli bacterium]
MSDYRNGTYVAFDGNNEVDPTKSDQKYFQLLKAWKENSDIEFTFSDSHSKTYQVRDSSSEETLKQRLKDRMKNSKNFLVIISNDTSFNRGMLNYEIELAVVTYKLPIIVVYVGYKKIKDPSLLSSAWCKNLLKYINNKLAKCIHVPFKKEPIFAAISQFSVVDNNYPATSLNYYNDQAYKSWGIM